MTTKEMIEALRKEGYTISIIAKQSGVPYMRLYRYACHGAALSDHHHNAAQLFARAQPCMARGET